MKKIVVSTLLVLGLITTVCLSVKYCEDRFKTQANFTRFDKRSYCDCLGEMVRGTVALDEKEKELAKEELKLC